MNKMQIGDLERIQSERLAALSAPGHRHLFVCGGTGCHATGSLALIPALKQEIESRGLSETVNVVETGCNGFCAMGPILVVHPDGVFYQKISLKDLPALVEEHFINGNYVEKLLYKDPGTKKRIALLKDIPFFAHQMPRALRNKGRIDPESIDDYIAYDGYKALHKALTRMEPTDIIDEMKTSSLRGRGGAGFPTGMKWDFASRSESDIKYVLCNADEGDPGAFMDRSILEADPHSVLEGMAIAARAIGSEQGYIYARTEYPLAIKRLEIAIEKARKYGLLGQDILGTGMNFDIDICQGAGAFVCGEETALMRSIEGKRGMPRPRPPFPANKGLWEKPTILNNVETLSNVPQITLKGGADYASIGTEKSKGTKVFAVSGDVNNIGLVEVPMGTPLSKIIFDIGGGIPRKREIKAVQLGGPSGGCVPSHLMDTQVDYDEIAKVGAIMGSGGVIVMDDHTCMVDMARFFMDFIQEESCGKCTPCREGTRRLLQILENICAGKGTATDLDDLEELAVTIREASLCGLGQTAPNPVLSTLRYFRDEYETHIHDKKCPARTCAALLDFAVDPDLCTACGMCFKACPADAIIWKKKEKAVIEKDKCVQCLTCFDRCRFDAIH